MGIMFDLLSIDKQNIDEAVYTEHLNRSAERFGLKRESGETNEQLRIRILGAIQSVPQERPEPSQRSENITEYS